MYIYIMEDVQPPPFHPGHLFPSSLPRAGPTLPSPSVFFSVVKDPVPVGRPCATSKSRPSSRGRRLLNDANHLPRWRGTRAAATRQLQPNDDGTGFPYFRGVESVWASGIQISEAARGWARASLLEPSVHPSPLLWPRRLLVLHHR